MTEQDAKSPAAKGVAAAAAPRVRVAAASRSGRLGGAVRASLGTGPKGSGTKKPSLRVRRARRLAGLAALALVTLLAAFVGGGLFILVNLLCDGGLIAYVRHLRAAARTRAARAAREKRARAARQAWERASARERASQIEGWPTPAADRNTASNADPDAAHAADHGVPGQTTADVDPAGLEQPAAIDLTDAPTEELVAAQAS